MAHRNTNQDCHARCRSQSTSRVLRSPEAAKTGMVYREYELTFSFLSDCDLLESWIKSAHSSAPSPPNSSRCSWRLMHVSVRPARLLLALHLVRAGASSVRACRLSSHRSSAGSTALSRHPRSAGEWRASSHGGQPARAAASDAGKSHGSHRRSTAQKQARRGTIGRRCPPAIGRIERRPQTTGGADGALLTD